MRKCNKECCDICDFCKHYHYNGIDLVGTDKDGNIIIIERAVYTNKGYCGLDLSDRDPADSCDKFVCENLTFKGFVKSIVFKFKKTFGLFPKFKRMK